MIQVMEVDEEEEEVDMGGGRSIWRGGGLEGGVETIQVMEVDEEEEVVDEDSDGEEYSGEEVEEVEEEVDMVYMLEISEDEVEEEEDDEE